MNGKMTGAKLKRLRQNNGLTQKDIARFLEYTIEGQPNRSQISKFENGHTQINARIGKLLDIYFENRLFDNRHGC